MIRIGVDVGGTNTDAVMIDSNGVKASCKVYTSQDVISGVSGALARLLDDSGVSSDQIDVVMIGTTHFTNAIVQRKHLAPTAAIRLGLPATACLPPMTDWPSDLRAAIHGRSYMLGGGYEFDGREIAPLDETGLRSVARELKDTDTRAIAVSSVFSPINATMEDRAEQILREEIPRVHVTKSHEVGRVGLLERENATIMNACLRDLSATVVNAFRDALRQSGLRAAMYLTQNDGTLMDATFAERFPVMTFASGPTNSMRGAAWLSGVSDAIVVDIGGTTSDAGLLRGGLPRQAGIAVEVGGVRTNFRMPDVFSVGLGGGSIVRRSAEGVTVGPDSVGYRLATEGMAFGGDTLTTTDVMIASGAVALGDPARLTSLPADLLRAARAEMERILTACVERARLSSEEIPVIVVGGGSVLVDQDRIAGLPVLKPSHFGVANAVGAAIAQVSGEVDKVYSLAAQTRADALADAKESASRTAVAAGADAATLDIAEIEEIPLAYLPGNATRIRVKVIGDLHVKA
ncbi:hydantoinase/oxoprolinase family protein [Acetobacter sacchari]|uniref:Hydantoinase/oxoprolinase family protein n=1 Tax=Acetobacter sacchari TaxID=2661687 RepID=A0ABS3LUC4_9PROT|nr:hydantoinase/oxoprolinase family protein [Acetobacter sacchari]MBO1359514.1 hydantoinase/oxoprolinase family protein [Acetobacter sacchari]